MSKEVLLLLLLRLMLLINSTCAKITIVRGAKGPTWGGRKLAN